MRPLRFLILSIAFALAFISSSTADTIGSSTDGTFTLKFNNVINSGVNLPGINAEATFSNFAFYSNTPSGYTKLTFDVALKNLSGGQVTASRIGILGFYTSPDIVLDPPGAAYKSSVTSDSGDYSTLKSGNFPNVGTVEFCFSAGPNCAGASGDGVTQGGSDTLHAVLYFAGANITTLAFNNVYIKWQSVDCPGCSPSIRGGSFESAGAPGAPPVPEPATMSLMGSGLASLYLRRRRTGNRNRM